LVRKRTSFLTFRYIKFLHQAMSIFVSRFFPFFKNTILLNLSFFLITKFLMHMFLRFLVVLYQLVLLQTLSPHMQLLH